MNLKKYSFLLLVVSACLVTENASAAAELASAAEEKAPVQAAAPKKVIGLWRQMSDSNPGDRNFSLFFRTTIGKPLALFTRISSNAEGKAYFQEIPVFEDDEQTGLTHRNIPEGHELSKVALVALEEHAQIYGRKNAKEWREVPESTHWQFDHASQKMVLK